MNLSARLMFAPTRHLFALLLGTERALTRIIAHPLLQGLAIAGPGGNENLALPRCGVPEVALIFQAG
jgi:hypothetical protein